MNCGLRPLWYSRLTDTDEVTLQLMTHGSISDSSHVSIEKDLKNTEHDKWRWMEAYYVWPCLQEITIYLFYGEINCKRILKGRFPVSGRRT